MTTDALTDFFKGLLNLPDLIILLLVLAGLVLGLRRGLLYTLCGVIGRLAALGAAVFAAKALAPGAAKMIVSPIVGEVFSRQAELGQAAGLLDGIKQTVTEAATHMAESIAFLALLLLLGVLFGWLISFAIKSLHFVAHLTPLGFLDALGGGVLGALGGVAIAALILLGIQWFAPITYTSLGGLSPERVQATVLLSRLIDILPVAI